MLLQTLRTEEKRGWRNYTVAVWIDAEDYDLEPLLTFSDKASYFAWVAEWKEAYDVISETIRMRKVQRKPRYRVGDTTENDVRRALNAKRAVARALLCIRKASKVKSGLQRAATARPNADRP
jgi:hypothetical protein